MTIRNICIYGAGALGGTFAARIANSLGEDVEVSVIARGPHLAAIQENGVTVLPGDASETEVKARVTAVSHPSQLPKQDLIVTGLKGHQLADAAEGLAGLLKSGTRVVMILNGIPWWYFHCDEASGFAERQFAELDPDGKLWSLVGPDRVIGCVAYQGAEVIAPGTVKLSGKGRYFLGEPSGKMSADLQAIGDLFSRSGLIINSTARIRDEIWTKLRGNAAFNPISALTRGRMNDMMGNPDLARMIGQVMNEVQAVGAALGCRFEVSADEHMKNASGFGPVKTSMLQDLLAGKPLEILPLSGMVVSMGKLAGIATPVCATVYTLAVELDRQNLIK